MAGSAKPKAARPASKPRATNSPHSTASPGTATVAARRGFTVDAASWLDATELWGTAMPRTMPPVRARLAPAPAA